MFILCCVAFRCQNDPVYVASFIVKAGLLPLGMACLGRLTVIKFFPSGSLGCDRREGLSVEANHIHPLIPSMTNDRIFWFTGAPFAP